MPRHRPLIGARNIPDDFPIDSSAKTAARSTALDTFYPLNPGNWVIIIRILIVLSRKTINGKWEILILE
jgi:hypothetical protein